MSETEIRMAIAQQEEYLKRIRSCSMKPDSDEPVYMASHSWDRFSNGSGETYRACWRCRVTESNDDYEIKLRGLEST